MDSRQAEIVALSYKNSVPLKLKYFIHLQVKGHELVRPNKILLGKSSGIIEASFEQTSSLLLHVKAGMVNGANIPIILNTFNVPEGAVTLEIRGGPDKFVVFSTGQYVGRLINLEILRKETLISLYGGYWYRGEYQLNRHEKGCLITLSIYNIAPGFTRVFVPFLKEYRMIVNEFRTKSSSSGFELLLRNLGDHLICKTYCL